MSDIARLTTALADRYRIERELGAGGMATVYLAEDLKHGRQVAIKVLREDLSASLGKERFLREIKVAAALQHPHVLPLYDSGEVGGLLYYVMPYVDGLSLREKLAKEGELPIPDAARILRDVADALSEAHKFGVVHRDLKPENVMLRGRHALVTDFGVAKALSEATGRQSLTTIGVALGTPTYMAPEQAVADPHVDHRADIYAFGVMAYELLSGRPPFTGMTPQQVLAAHVTATAEPVTTHRNVPPALAQLVMKCLEKKPADRPQSAEELISTLESVLTPSGGMTPTDTRPLTAHAVPVKRASVFGRIALVAGVLVLAAAAAFAWRSRHATNASNERSIAVLPFDDVAGDTANRAFILGVHGEIVTQMTSIPGMKLASRQASSAYYGTKKAPADIARELGVDKLLTGTVQRAGGKVHFQVELQDVAHGGQVWARSYDQALTAENLFAIQGEVARNVASALSLTLTDAKAAELSKAPTKDLDALDLYHRGDLLYQTRNTGPIALGAARLFREAVKRDPKFYQAWGLLSQAESWLLRQGVAFDTLPARQALDRVVALAPGSLEARLASGYYHYYGLADFTRAIEEFKEAARLEPTSAEPSEAIGLLSRRLGRYDDATPALQHAIELDPQLFSARLDLLVTFYERGMLKESAKVADELTRLYPTTYEPAELRLATLFELGDSVAALAYAREARTRLTATDVEGLDLPIAISRRDMRAMFIGAKTSGALLNGYYGDGPGGDAILPSVQVAMLYRLSGDRAKARIFADSAIHLADSTVRLARRRAGDPFGIIAFSDVLSAIAHAAAGDSALAIQIGEAAQRAYPAARDGADGPIMYRYLAIVYTLTGRVHDAVSQLTLAASVPVTAHANELARSPLWDSLRGDPGFKALVARLGK